MSSHAEDLTPFVPGMARSLSIVRAGEILGVSRRTVYYLIRDGRLQTIRTQMGSRRVLVDSLKSCWEERA